MASEKTTKKAAKMCGYLERRGKLTITGKWKKWWCVLEGQLLLYYKSRTQYLKLSPCCGSLNMALVKSVQPHTNRQIHMLTHSQLVILRASSKEKQQSWFLAFVNVLPKNKYEAFISKRTDRTSKVSEQCDYCRSNSNEYNDLHSKIPRQNDDVDLNFRARIQEADLVDNSRFENMGAQSLTDGSKIDRSNSNSINWNSEKSSVTDGKRSSSHDNLEATADATQLGRDIRMKRFYSVQCITNLTGDATMLSTEKSFSYHSIVRYNYHSPSYFRGRNESHFERNRARQNSKEKGICNHKVKRKESFNFLKKVFSNHLKRKDRSNKLDSAIQRVAEKEEQTTVTKTLENYLENHNDKLAEVQDLTDSTVDKNTEEISRDKEQKQDSEEYTSPTVMTVRNSKRFSNYLPSRITDNVQCDESPILPVKRKVNSAIYSSKIAELNSGAYDSIGKGFKPEMRYSGPNLDLLLQQLSMITQDELRSEPSIQEDNEECEEDPDYDVPIPHASLIDRKTENDSSHSYRSENSFDFNMTPDSLEVPWINRWSTPDYVFDTSNNQTGSDGDVFLDSLTSHLRL